MLISLTISLRSCYEAAAKLPIIRICLTNNNNEDSEERPRLALSAPPAYTSQRDDEDYDGDDDKPNEEDDDYAHMSLAVVEGQSLSNHGSGLSHLGQELTDKRQRVLAAYRDTHLGMKGRLLCHGILAMTWPVWKLSVKVGNWEDRRKLRHYLESRWTSKGERKDSGDVEVGTGRWRS